MLAKLLIVCYLKQIGRLKKIDSITLVQFVLPALIAIIFTMLAVTSLKKPDWL